MLRAFWRPILIFRARIDIAAHVTARNPDVPHQGGHNVREILTNSLAGFDGMVDGRIDPRRLGHVTRWSMPELQAWFDAGSPPRAAWEQMKNLPPTGNGGGI